MRHTPLAHSPYMVQLLDCPGLDGEQRSAAELRFKMALEAALGGADYVLPTLQAYMLAQLLNDGAEVHEDAPDREPVDRRASEVDEDTEAVSEAEDQVIELWEAAEAQAILIAMKPLGGGHVNAQFQLRPVQRKPA